MCPFFPTQDPSHPIFESGPTPAHKEDKPDAEMSLMESPFVTNRTPGPGTRRSGDPPSDALRQPPVLRSYAMAFPAALIPGRTNWRLAAQHPAGSLQAAVDTTRRANLMMSFGALVILFGSSSLLFAAMHRTRALAKMQMEFVAGVSHELRTPVSVICSAADNLAEGVVDGKSQVQNYGQMIRGEARRLASMVEQILLFSAGKQNTARYNLQPLDIASVIEGVLRDNAAGIASAGMTLERAIDPDLPHVIGGRRRGGPVSGESGEQCHQVRRDGRLDAGVGFRGPAQANRPEVADHGRRSWHGHRILRPAPNFRAVLPRKGGAGQPDSRNGIGPQPGSQAGSRHARRNSSRKRTRQRAAALL